MIKPNNVMVPPRTNVKSLLVLSCMSRCLLRNEAPNQEENQKTGSENRRRNTGWSIGLIISCASICNRSKSTTAKSWCFAKGAERKTRGRSERGPAYLQDCQK